MPNLAAIAPPAAHLFGEGQNEYLPRIAALSAAIAAIAILITGACHSPAHADGGASSARSQTATPAPDDGGATLRDYTLRILSSLTDRHSNNWARYWQARAACDAPATSPAALPLDRALLALTANICARLETHFGVNPADYQPRGEDRTVGLLLNQPAAAAGYTLFTTYWNHDAFLIDPLGRVAHAWHTEMRFINAKLLDNGNLLVAARSNVSEIDPRGNVVWQYAGGPIDFHDFLKMPNGNILLLAETHKTREEAIAAGANPELVPEFGFLHDYLLEVRPDYPTGGEIVWQWSVWDHLVQDFDPTKPNYGAIAEHPELININFPPIPKPDRTHINSVDYNPELDQIMLSPRNFSELWIIDRSATTEEARGHAGGNSGMGGDLLYRWGNPRAYDRGDVADQRLFWQHQTHWIPPGLPGAGNILLFNNGNEFKNYRRHYSSVDELIPPANGYRYRRAENAAYPPDAPEWTYAAETPSDFYAPITSGAQRLPNGNTFIVDGTAGTIFQVTPDGKIAWKYVAPLDWLFHLRQGDTPSIWETFPNPYGDPVPWLTNSVYRAYWYPPDYPGLQALDLTPGAFIEDLPDIYDLARNAALAGAFGEPIANSHFDIYLDGESEYARRLIYLKQPCAAEDAQPSVFLHIIPADARDLPAHRQEYGFDNLDFNLLANEIKMSDGRCIAARDLPAYPIQRIRTGQFTDAGQLWGVDINLNE